MSRCFFAATFAEVIQRVIKHNAHHPTIHQTMYLLNVHRITHVLARKMKSAENGKTGTCRRQFFVLLTLGSCLEISVDSDKEAFGDVILSGSILFQSAMTLFI